MIGHPIVVGKAGVFADIHESHEVAALVIIAVFIRDPDFYTGDCDAG